MVMVVSGISKFQTFGSCFCTGERNGVGEEVVGGDSTQQQEITERDYSYCRQMEFDRSRPVSGRKQL